MSNVVRTFFSTEQFKEYVEKALMEQEWFREMSAEKKEKIRAVTWIFLLEMKHLPPMDTPPQITCEICDGTEYVVSTYDQGDNDGINSDTQ